MRAEGRHTGQVRHTVRQRLRGTSGSQAAIAVFALTVVLIVVGVAVTASRDGGAAPVGESATTPTTVGSEPGEPTSDDGEPLLEEAADEGGWRSSVAAMVAGFGLLGLWVAGGGVALFRARRRRNGVPEGDRPW